MVLTKFEIVSPLNLNVEIISTLTIPWIATAIHGMERVKIPGGTPQRWKGLRNEPTAQSDTVFADRTANGEEDIKQIWW